MKTPLDSKYNYYYELHLKHLSLKGLQPNLDKPEPKREKSIKLEL